MAMNSWPDHGQRPHRLLIKPGILPVVWRAVESLTLDDYFVHVDGLKKRLPLWLGFVHVSDNMWRDTEVALEQVALEVPLLADMFDGKLEPHRQRKRKSSDADDAPRKREPRPPRPPRDPANSRRKRDVAPQS